MEATGASSIRRFAAAALISTLGTDAAAVGFGFYLYARTHSAIWLSAWWFLSFGIGGVLTPVGGWLADRLNRQRLLIAVDFGGAACSTILVVLRAPAGIWPSRSSRRSSDAGTGRRRTRRFPISPAISPSRRSTAR